MVGVPREEHEKVLLHLVRLNETLGIIQSALDAIQARVQALKLGQANIQKLESSQAQMEVKLDLLIRVQQPMAKPTYSAQAPPSYRGTNPDTA